MSAGLDSVIAPELVKAMSEQFTMELSATVPAAVFQARPVVIKQISLGHARRARCGRCGYGSVCIRGKSTMIGAVRVLSHLSMTCLHCQINVEPMMGIAHSRTSMGRFSAFGFSGTIAHGCFTTISSSRSKTNIRGAFSFHRYQRRNHGEKHVDASEPSTEDDTSFLDMGVHSRCLV
ncbi:hypothetical protein AURANDRAFT_67708 [Aureococcus anophagefferens]|uniref:Uncharacterized protein n=1 Tax=Aureococcus anophagefferens TaxID=44056 RepID=F0YM47_AURAN|nr:hypothetical protein AURANDRAFT_67708 [Aureococcus anophagefferens]EGB03815.1 hypothetical protein AURANDRAFT_67708 [Aureococcus anophagefferens]|eukprot:XP_009041473.1 hypothetical protein AURANDRAFT_67708 [Aureococcus anophagefferens]